jgi:hypothetical protein
MYVPTSRPGHRAPHIWLTEDETLYDRFSVGFNLVRTNPSVDISDFVAEATMRGLPLAVVDIDTPETRAVYPFALTLVRPDLMVAWRANVAPTTSEYLWDKITGHFSTS